MENLMIYFRQISVCIILYEDKCHMGVSKVKHFFIPRYRYYVCVKIKMVIDRYNAVRLQISRRFTQWDIRDIPTIFINPI